MLVVKKGFLCSGFSSQPSRLGAPSVLGAGEGYVTPLGDKRGMFRGPWMANGYAMLNRMLARIASRLRDSSSLL